MAKVLAVFDDLLLGSNVVGILRAAGHEVTLAPGPAVDRPGAADVIVVDVASEGFDAVAMVERLREEGAIAGVALLGLHSHVHPDQRDRAEAAGFDLVVPRSRFMREGAQLVERLAARSPDQ